MSFSQFLRKTFKIQIYPACSSISDPTEKEQTLPHQGQVEGDHGNHPRFTGNSASVNLLCNRAQTKTLQRVRGLVGAADPAPNLNYTKQKARLAKR